MINGQEWEWLNPLPTGKSMQSLSFPDSLTGYAVGECGTIIKTTNGGLSWIIQSSGTYETLYAVDFTDPDTGYAVGAEGTILKTTNGGSDWMNLTFDS